MKEQRRRIQQLDELLLDILEERVEVGKELARLKTNGVEDKAQEKKVIRRAVEGSDKLDDDHTEWIFEEIIRLTKKHMRAES